MREREEREERRPRETRGQRDLVAGMVELYRNQKMGGGKGSSGHGEVKGKEKPVRSAERSQDFNKYVHSRESLRPACTLYAIGRHS